MSQWASNLFDTILPRRSADDPAQRFSTELVYGFGAFELLATSAFCLTELAWGTAMLGAVYAAAWVPILLILIWLRNGGEPARASAALMVVLFTLVTATNFSTGGRAIGANIALPTIVLFAVLMSSPRAAMVWTALAVIEIFVVARLRNSGLEFPIKPNPEWTKSAIDRVPLFFSLASALIALITRRALQHFQVSLEEAREEATATAGRFTDFAEMAADGFWETDADLRLTYVSPGFAQVMGLQIEQMLGRTPEQAYRLRFPNLPEASNYSEVLEQHQLFSGQILRMLDKTGRKGLLLNQGLPRFNNAGVFQGYRGVVQDVTAQSDAERALRANEQRLRSITENIPATVAYLDHEERYRFCNQLALKMLGVDGAAVLGRTKREVCGEVMYGRVAEQVAAALRGEIMVFEGESVYENRRRHFQTTYIPDIAADERVTGFYAITFDITDIKQSQLELTEISNRLRLITDNMPALISYIDADRIFRFNNSAYEKWLDRPLESITGHRVSELYDAATYQLVEPYLDRALKGEQVTFEMEPLGHRTRHVRVTYVPEIDAKGNVLGTYGLINDISELKRVERQLRILAEYDTLTGLLNRNRFKVRLSEAISRSERNDDTLALLYLDIDHFKSINDSLGHQAGDEVLKEFARRLTRCIRQTDKLTRLAGDEFVIVLEGMHGTEETSIVAKKIIAAMASPFSLVGQERLVSTSIGVVIRRKGELDGDSLVRRADEALYVAKDSGRGGFHLAPAED